MPLQAKQLKLVNHIVVRRVHLRQHREIVELEEGSASRLKTSQILSEDNLISRSHVEVSLPAPHLRGKLELEDGETLQQTQTSGDGC